MCNCRVASARKCVCLCVRVFCVQVVLLFKNAQLPVNVHVSACVISFPNATGVQPAIYYWQERMLRIVKVLANPTLKIRSETSWAVTDLYTLQAGLIPYMNRGVVGATEQAALSDSQRTYGIGMPF